MKKNHADAGLAKGKARAKQALPVIRRPLYDKKGINKNALL